MNTKFGIALLSAFSLLSVGCGSDSSSSATYTESLSVTIDEVAKTITVAQPTCEVVNGSAVYDPAGATLVYTYDITDNQLVLEDNFDFIELYTGNNSSIYGHWVDNSEYCLEMKVCENIDISTSSMSRSVDLSNACSMELYYDTMLSEMNDYVKNVEISDCNTATFTIMGLEASMKISSYSATGMEGILSIGSTSCKIISKAQPLTKDLCTIENIENIEDDVFISGNSKEFTSCMNGALSSVISDQEMIDSFSKALKLKK